MLPTAHGSQEPRIDKDQNSASILNDIPIRIGIDDAGIESHSLWRYARNLQTHAS